MNFKKWTKQKMKKIEWYDISLVKLTCFAFGLLIAKLWPTILSLDWYWYLIIAILAAIIPFKKVWFD